MVSLELLTVLSIDKGEKHAVVELSVNSSGHLDTKICPLTTD